MDFYLLVIALALGSPQAGRCICSPARVPVTRTPTSGTSVGTSLRLLSSWLSVGFPCSWPLQMDPLGVLVFTDEEPLVFVGALTGCYADSTPVALSS